MIEKWSLTLSFRWSTLVDALADKQTLVIFRASAHLARRSITITNLVISSAPLELPVWKHWKQQSDLQWTANCSLQLTYRSPSTGRCARCWPHRWRLYMWSCRCAVRWRWRNWGRPKIRLLSVRCLPTVCLRLCSHHRKLPTLRPFELAGCYAATWRRTADLRLWWCLEKKLNEISSFSPWNSKGSN